MSAKQLVRLALVLGVLLLLWGAAALARRGGNGEPESDRLAIPSPARRELDSLIIARPSDTTRLVRRDSTRWTVNGYSAGPTAIADLFSALGDSTRRTELVAVRSRSHAGFGVDSAKGTRVRFVRGDSVLADLVVGNRSTDLDGGYFRTPGDSSVYLVRGRLAEVLGRATDEWRDRRMASVPSDSVARIEVARGSRTYNLRRDGSSWNLGPGRPADSAAVAGLLGDYREVEAAGFASPAQADSANFKRPERRATLYRPDGTALLRLAFDSAGSEFWVRAGEDSTVYRVDSWSADRLAPADSSLRAGKR